MSKTMASNPEPVPAATQIAISPFLAAVSGFMQNALKLSNLRLTIHRVVARNKEVFLQQACDYAGTASATGVGRYLPVDAGIIGRAFSEKKIIRTKKYALESLLLEDLASDMKATNDNRNIDTVQRSYLAIPFLSLKSEPVIILYADSMNFNAFAGEEISVISAMCSGFGQLIDRLQDGTISGLRNFPLPDSESRLVEHGPTVYPKLQEALEIPVPSFSKIESFNFEMVAE